MQTFIDKHKYIDTKTGEILPTRTVTKVVTTPYQFWRVNMIDFLNTLGLIGGKSVKVYSFIISHISSKTNKLYMNGHQIKKAMAAHGTKVSVKTVYRAINKLKSVRVGRHHKPFLTCKRFGERGKYSYLMLNPDIAMGRNGKYNNLLIHYERAGSKPKKLSSKKQPKISAKSQSKAAAIKIAEQGKIKKPVKNK